MKQIILDEMFIHFFGVQSETRGEGGDAQHTATFSISIILKVAQIAQVFFSVKVRCQYILSKKWNSA